MRTNTPSLTDHIGQVIAAKRRRRLQKELDEKRRREDVRRAFRTKPIHQLDGYDEYRDVAQELSYLSITNYSNSIADLALEEEVGMDRTCRYVAPFMFQEANESTTQD